ncbi:Alpha/Beta hydrolase protein [Xylariaceae sp. FL1272]|nr:Alpha/Beta hydrolase protein [Xylariaceae sp. FL1272]
MILQFLFVVVLLSGACRAAPAQSSHPHSSSGCGNHPRLKLGQRHNVTLASGRRYLVWVPLDYDANKKSPLIFSHHGANKTPDQHADLDLLTTPHFNRDHIVVYPSSETYPWNNSTGRYWQGSPQVGESVDDVGFVLDIFEAIKEEFCIDLRRVYATGKSQGGMMVNNLACDARSSSVIAAFAPVSGSYYVNVTEEECDPLTLKFECKPSRRDVPMLFFHGGDDMTIAYGGGVRSGECLPYIPHFVSKWAQRVGLGDKPVRDSRLARDNSSVYTYGTGRRHGLVSLVYDGNHVRHDWPSTNVNADQIENGSGPATFNASSIIMDFFRRYTLA